MNLKQSIQSLYNNNIIMYLKKHYNIKYYGSKNACKRSIVHLKLAVELFIQETKISNKILKLQEFLFHFVIVQLLSLQFALIIKFSIVIIPVMHHE